MPGEKSGSGENPNLRARGSFKGFGMETILKKRRRKQQRKARRLRVAVLYGGWGSERTVSLRTGRNVLEGLRAAGYETLPLRLTGADRNRRRLAARLRRARPDAAFVALHGRFGEDGGVQLLLEELGIPYTGSGPLACALSFHKGYAKMIWESKGLPTPPWRAYRRSPAGNRRLRGDRRRRLAPRGLPLPVVVKPADSGSTVGVSVVRRRREYRAAFAKAFRESPWVLEEKFVPGVEITVGVVGERALPVLEIVPKGGFYDWKAKYAPGGSRHIIPARLPVRTRREAARLALAAGKALGCSGYWRVDLIVPREGFEGRPQLLEVNTVPGMTKTSLVPDMAAAAGIPFPRLLRRIVELALMRERGPRASRRGSARGGGKAV